MTKILATVALPVAATAILGGAALGLAGAANAAATGQAPSGPGYSYSPQTLAHPAPTVGPGWHGNHGPAYIAHLTGADQK
jgi:hypothetical protein